MDVQKLVEEFNELVKVGAIDKEEYQEQIIQLANKLEGVTDKLVDRWLEVQEIIQGIENTIERKKRDLLNSKNEIEQIKATLLVLIEATGEEHKKSLRLFGSFAKIDRRVSVGVKEDLDINEVPNEFQQYIVKDKLTKQEYNRFIKDFKGKKVESSIDKKELTKYAKAYNLQEIYLEEKPYVVLV